MIYPGFIGGTNRLQGVMADCSRLLNLYPEQRTLTGRPSLNAWPGQSLFVTAAEIGVRALVELNDLCLAVVGPKVYRVNANGTLTLLGSVTQDANRAYITMNGRAGGQALISSGTNGYYSVLPAGGPTLVLPGAAYQIGMLDGYGIAFDRNLARFRISDLNDFSTWDPTQFQSRNDAPDDWVAMIVNAPDVILLGKQTGSVWYDAGTFPMPLAPRPGVNFPSGIAAPDSLAVVGDGVWWLRSNKEGSGVVVRMRGYVPQRISTFAVETAIAGYMRTSRIDDAEGMGIEWQGHSFYILNFPTAGHSWACDADSGDWFELSSFSGGKDTIWRSRVHCLAFGMHLVGDRTSGAIAYLDITKGTEADGATQRLMRIPPSLLARDADRLEVHRFRLLIQGGIGAVVGTDPATNPVAMLRWSEDFAQTWGNEIQATLGPIGTTQTEVFWDRLGSSLTGWVPEVVITDPARPISIIGADILGQKLGVGNEQAA